MTDNLDFDQIVDICLDQLRAGDAVADCLARYPQHAAQLAPLLQAASLLRTSSDLAMSAQGLRAGRARMLAHAAALRAQRKAAVLPLIRITRRLVATSLVGTLLVCALLSAGTVSAAASLPGSPLYPVKRAAETVISRAAFTPQLKTAVHLAWADRRLREAAVLMARDGTADEMVLAAIEQETEQALAAAEQAGPEQLTAVAAHTQHQQAVLQAVLEKAPPPARPQIERAKAASAEDQARAQSALDRTAPGKPDKENPQATPPGQVAPGKPDKENPQGTPPGQVAPGKPDKENPQGMPPGQAAPGKPDKENPQDTPPGQVAPGKPEQEQPTDIPPGQASQDQPGPQKQPPAAVPSSGIADRLRVTPSAKDELDELGQPNKDEETAPAPNKDTGQGQGQGQGQGKDHTQNPGLSLGKGQNQGQDKQDKKDDTHKHTKDKTK